MAHPLVEESMKKAAIAWVSVGGAPARAVWCFPSGDALCVVSGPGEQHVPGLDPADQPAAGQALVTLRGDHGGRVVTWPAAVTRVHPGTEEWTELVPQVAGKRLNASSAAETLAARWAAECAVHKLTPAGDPVEAGPDLPDASLAEPPRTSTRRPRRRFALRRRPAAA